MSNSIIHPWSSNSAASERCALDLCSQFRSSAPGVRKLTRFYRYTEDDVQPSAAPVPAEVKTEPVVVNGTSEVKQEESNGAYEEAVGGDQGEYNGDDADDDVDFNLGNGNDYSSSAPRENQGPGIKEDG